MASIIKADTLQSTTANVFIQNSVGTEYARFDSTGVFQLANPSSFPAGNVASPSITASGDTNTGIFFSAADTIDFAEGGTATGQFDSSGNFKFNSGYGSVATAFGCRAWVNFDGTGTPAIRASGNVTSITDQGVGDYTLNLTTALTDIKYSVAGFVNESGRIVTGRGVAFTTSAIRIGSYVASSQSLEDQSVICVAVFR